MALEMSDRDRRIATFAGILLGLALVVAIPIGTEILARRRVSENEALRASLASVQDARNGIALARSKQEAIKLRYAKKVEPSLTGFVEKQARDQKLEVAEMTEAQPVAAGKKYSERQAKLRLKKSGMLAIANFLEAIEKSGYPVIVSRLNLRKRGAEQDSYDLELTVSSFERSEDKKEPK